MGVLPRIEALATGMDAMTIYREGGRRPARIDFTKIIAAASDRNVEIMRDDLSEIYFDAGRDEVEYVFGDSITAISLDGEVTFERAAPRGFDVVVGADGLHSNVRRLVFGDEARLTRFIGGYLAVVSVPKSMAHQGEMVGHVGAGRLAAIYSAQHLDDARAVFLFRTKIELDYDYRDAARQKELLHDAFAGLDPQVDSWLAETDQTPAFYFDSITQLQLDTWSRGRVTLVGDAGYCPGPAVGGSTSLAVIGAYVLAGELARASGDHVAAFAAYEKQMREPVRLSCAFARGAAKGVIPGSAATVWAMIRGMQLVSLLPASLTRTVAKFNTKGVRMYEAMRVPDYSAFGNIADMKLDLLGSKHTLFRLFYRLGFTPWDGHPLAQSLRNRGRRLRSSRLPTAHPRCRRAPHSNLVAAPATPPSTWPSEGWQVTAVDFVPCGAGEGAGQGTRRQHHRQLRPRRCPALTSSRNQRPDAADRRQRLPAQHERRRPRLLCPGGQRRRSARRAAADRRVRSRRTIRRARHRPERDGTAFRIRLDVGVRRRRAGARPREDPDAVLPFPARRLGQRELSTNQL